MNLSPKTIFNATRKPEAEQLSALAGQAWFQSALLHVYAELSTRGKGVEYLSGANDFANVLLSFTAIHTQTALPSKELKTLK